MPDAASGSGGPEDPPRRRTRRDRVTTVELYPELWEVVERAPNFMLPAALVYLVYQHRIDHRAGVAGDSEVMTPTAR